MVSSYDELQTKEDEWNLKANRTWERICSFRRKNGRLVFRFGSTVLFRRVIVPQLCNDSWTLVVFLWACLAHGWWIVGQTGWNFSCSTSLRPKPSTQHLTARCQHDDHDCLVLMSSVSCVCEQKHWQKLDLLSCRRSLDELRLNLTPGTFLRRMHIS